MRFFTQSKSLFGLVAGLLLPVCVAVAASLPVSTEPLLEVSPSNLQGYVFVAEPTREGIASLRAGGKRPLVESHEITDEAVALTNWAESASAVAFDVMPRAHLLHTWKLLGVTLLKTVRFEPEGTADHFRREVSFMAFQAGADGVWLPNAEQFPESWKLALAEAREDWRIMAYLRKLSLAAQKHPDSKVWIEGRRVNYWFGWMPADWENLDTLRFECIAYAKRLEQLLGLPPADLKVALSSSPEPQCLSFMPYSDWPERPVQKPIKKLGDTLRFDGGLVFKADKNGFSITYTQTNGPSLKQWANPGGEIDVRLYIPTDKPGVFLPYRFHCDLDPQWYGERAPATGRESWLFGIDERFRPYSIAYAHRNIRALVWPRLRDFTPDYPNPRPSFSLQGNKEGGWQATLSFSWLAFYGHWPMQRDGKNDVWFIGIDKAPYLDAPVAGRVLFPRGSKKLFTQFAASMTTGGITEIYKEELVRAGTMWTTARAESYYPSAKTEEPTFQRYDVESDGMFYERMVKPLVDANENAWQLIWTDKEHPNPKFMKQQDSVKRLIWDHLGRMLYLSYDVGLLRRDYLLMRYAGEEPPEREKKDDLSRQDAPEEPDVDYDMDAIQLEDKEF